LRASIVPLCIRTSIVDGPSPSNDGCRFTVSFRRGCSDALLDGVVRIPFAEPDQLVAAASASA
jgi:hypothetical protein